MPHSAQTATKYHQYCVSVCFASINLSFISYEPQYQWVVAEFRIRYISNWNRRPIGARRRPIWKIHNFSKKCPTVLRFGQKLEKMINFTLLLTLYMAKIIPPTYSCCTACTSPTFMPDDPEPNFRPFPTFLIPTYFCGFPCKGEVFKKRKKKTEEEH